MSLAETSITGIGNEATRFKPGQSGNPGGKPVGALRVLNKRFVRDVLASWEASGPSALTALSVDKPDKYCELIASMLPTETTVNVNNATTPGLDRLSRNLEWLSRHIERVRAEREATVSVPERPVLSAPVRVQPG